jgi:Tfp pilus assembly protein PilP
MKDKMNTLEMPGRAQGLRASAAGRNATPRELGSWINEARARLSEPVTPLEKAPRVAVQYRA